MIIVGAGMAGLLAGALLRSRCDAIYEVQSSLPNNHSALLRFRVPLIGDLLNIPFKKVQVLKAVEPWKNPVADALSYSRKTNGDLLLRSITNVGSAMETRYIAPPHLIDLMYSEVTAPTYFGVKSIFDNDMSPVISTIPMPQLMQILQWPDIPEFKYREGYNISFRIPGLDAYASLYIPTPAYLESRISITGDLVTIETTDKGSNKTIDEAIDDWSIPYALRDRVNHACRLLGLHDSIIDFDSVIIKKQSYAKIVPIDERLRKRFIFWASQNHGIYSFGRFATWRPGLLMDDLPQDLRVIQNIIAHGQYDHNKG